MRQFDLRHRLGLTALLLVLAFVRPAAGEWPEKHLPYCDSWAFSDPHRRTALPGINCVRTGKYHFTNPSPLIPIEKPAATEVRLKEHGGTFVVPVQINGAITLDFSIDSGAADVSIPADVFSTLLRTDTIGGSDIIGRQTYVLADGSESRSTTFTIRSLRIGDRVVENVKGSVAPSRGDLLLGQSFLARFKSWSIDNTTHKLLLYE